MLFTYSKFYYNSIIMKIIDCFMYYDEDMILDIRLNILDKFVSNFIICEANFNHNGTNRELKFNINNYKKFKDKIIYFPLENQPDNLHLIDKNDNKSIKNSKTLDNALLRENFQRNSLQKKIDQFSNDDLILISDVDEIPNLNNYKYKAKVTFFKQKMFYYKLNLLYDEFDWFGSKACIKKNFISPQWLRNIKSKKYPKWRLDLVFSKKKYSNIFHVQNGGWHFTCMKSPEDLEKKLLNFAHHYEYEESGLNISDIKKLINEKRVMYDHNVDQRGYKWSGKAKLKRLSNSLLPNYISTNPEKFKEWLD